MAATPTVSALPGQPARETAPPSNTSRRTDPSRPSRTAETTAGDPSSSSRWTDGSVPTGRDSILSWIGTSAAQGRKRAWTLRWPRAS